MTAFFLSTTLLVLVGTPVVAKTKCTVATAKISLAADTLCQCEIVTTGMIKYIQRHPDFLQTVSDLSAQCPGMASVLSDFPTATVSPKYFYDAGGQSGTTGASNVGTEGSTGGTSGGGSSDGGNDAGENSGGSSGNTGNTGGNSGTGGNGDTGGNTGGGTGEDAGGGKGNGGGQGNNGGGSKGNNGGGNGSEGNSPGKGKGANDDE